MNSDAADLFPGDGDVARICRGKDWTGSPLGPPGTWPVALRILTGSLIVSRHPSLLLWGPEHIQFYNDAFVSCLGPDEVDPEALGSSVHDVPTPAWKALGPRLETVGREGVAVSEENHPIRLDRDSPSGEAWWSFSASPVRDGDGVIRGMLVLCRDTTEEVRALESARRSSLRLTRTLESITDAFFTLDRDWNFTFLNREAERVLERSREELLGSNIWDEFPEAAGTTSQEEYERAMYEDVPVAFEQFYPPLDRWFSAKAFPSEEGIAVYFLDITDRKRLLAQFLRAQRMESIGTLAGGIAHDLNNVLSPILLSIAMLKEDIDDPGAIETLEAIEASAQHGAQLVRQVLGFARGVEGARSEIELEGILEEIRKVVRDTFPPSITLETRLADDLWPIRGDATQIHQIFMNLFVNARDAMPEGGTLTVEVGNVHLDEQFAHLSSHATPGPYLRISVMDTGTGMPDEVLAQVFDPFFTTKDVGHGTGLGLSTVSAIVRGHDGVINIHSEPGRGTTFRIYLPAAAPDDLEPPRPAGGELARGRGEGILVVDDEPAVREITKQTLATFGYRASVASNGSEAVEIYRRERDSIGLVLTDMMMPEMDGPATIRALLEIDPELRIIAASGVGGGEELARATEAGIRGFLAKPYTAETLLRTIHEVLHDG